MITGVQIHNWAYDFEDESPNLEFVAPTSAYVVVNGQKTHIDLAAMPVGARRACQRGAPTLMGLLWQARPAGRMLLTSAGSCLPLRVLPFDCILSAPSLPPARSP